MHVDSCACTRLATQHFEGATLDTESLMRAHDVPKHVGDLLAYNVCIYVYIAVCKVVYGN